MPRDPGRKDTDRRRTARRPSDNKQDTLRRTNERTIRVPKSQKRKANAAAKKAAKKIGNPPGWRTV